ncbi:MAG TPA: DUF4403 family protein [Lentimicrobium sp.]|nr:DUF4403 family protein [Lentimicrobium sp.]
MRIRYFKNTSFIIFSSILFSCTSVKVQKPAEVYLPGKFSSQQSTLNLTIRSDIKTIQKDLNKKLTGLIMEDNSLENNGGDNVMFKAWKQSDIVLDIDGNTLSYKVPLKTWINAGFNITKFGITLKDYHEFNGAIQLNLKTDLTLNPDWTITTKTTSEGYEWLSTPTIRIAGYDFSIKFVADIIMQASLKKIGSLIDETIKEDLSFRPYAVKGWDALNNPFKINDQYNIWLKVQPDKIISSRLSADKGVIKHGVGVTGSILLSIGHNDILADAVNTTVTKPLPDILFGKVPEGNSQLHAYFTVGFDEINKSAEIYLKGKKFSQGRKHVNIEAVKIYGNEGNLVAETTLSGSFNGTIYFKGIPAYRQQDSSLVVNDFDYDLSTKNFLIKSASWLYQDGFRKMIAKELAWNIGKEMKMVKSVINQNLKSFKVQDGLLLTGNVDEIYPGKIQITSKGIISEVVATGKIGLVVESINF